MAKLTELQRHIAQCRTDREYFYASELWIHATSSDLVPFGQLYPAPKAIQKSKDEHDAAGRPFRGIVLKARRHRVSSIVQANLCHDMLFKDNTRAYVVWHEAETLHVPRDMMGTFLDNTGDYLKCSRSKDSTWAIYLRETNCKTFYKTAGGGGTRTGFNQGGKGVGRSDRIDALHGSEVAFWADGGQSMYAAAQSMPEEPGTWALMESTANGMGGFFYEFYMDNRDNPASDWETFFFPWFTHPEYTVAYLAGKSNRPELLLAEDNRAIFADWKAAEAIQAPEAEALRARIFGGWDTDDRPLDDEERGLALRHGVTLDQLAWRRWWIPNKCENKVELFHQEFPSTDQEAFLTSGVSRFDNAKLTVWIRKRPNIQTVRLEPSVAGWTPKLANVDPKMRIRAASAPDDLQVYEMPQDGESYVVGGDASHGRGQDDSALVVVKASDLSTVAWRHSPLCKPQDLADWLIETGWLYGGAMIAQELNQPGNLTVHELVQRRYPRLYYRTRYERGYKGYSQEPGFETDSKTKEKILSHLDHVVTHADVDNPPLTYRLLCQQMTKMLMDGGARGASITQGNKPRKTITMAGYHDDLVMAAAIALWVAANEGESLRRYETPDLRDRVDWRLQRPTLGDFDPEDEVLDQAFDDFVQWFM